MVSLVKNRENYCICKFSISQKLLQNNLRNYFKNKFYLRKILFQNTLIKRIVLKKTYMLEFLIEVAYT